MIWIIGQIHIITAVIKLQHFKAHSKTNKQTNKKTHTKKPSESSMQSKWTSKHPFGPFSELHSKPVKYSFQNWPSKFNRLIGWENQATQGDRFHLRVWMESQGLLLFFPPQIHILCLECAVKFNDCWLEKLGKKLPAIQFLLSWKHHRLSQLCVVINWVNTCIGTYESGRIWVGKFH